MAATNQFFEWFLKALGSTETAFKFQTTLIWCVSFSPSSSSSSTHSPRSTCSHSTIPCLYSLCWWLEIMANLVRYDVYAMSMIEVNSIAKHKAFIDVEDATIHRGTHIKMIILLDFFYFRVFFSSHSSPFWPSLVALPLRWQLVVGVVVLLVCENNECRESDCVVG